MKGRLRYVRYESVAADCVRRDGFPGTRHGGSRYGRVTDPGRFAELHAVGRDLLDELESRFVVIREISSEHDRYGAELAPAVRLVPADPAASPLTIAFDGFPGLIVPTGHEDWMHLPVCGCDAFGETV